MKTTKLGLIAGCLSTLLIVSCQHDAKELPVPQKLQTENLANRLLLPGEEKPYNIELIGPIAVSNGWQYTWKIQNINPGNGNNGTAQGLSHWGFSAPKNMLGATCFNLSNVKSAAYSANGINWTTFTPSLKVDPAGCLSTPVLKFDFGTNGNAYSYYRLVLNQQYPTGMTEGYFKSGKRTGCVIYSFPGIVCPLIGS